jgi:hypothetical protein
MDLNVYWIEWWAKQHLGEIQASAARAHLVESLRQRVPLRVALGVALISLGRRLQGHQAGAATPAPGAAL